MAVDSEITRISSFLGLRWKSFARELGLSQTDIGCIQTNNHDLRDQIHDMFSKWKMMEGNKASVEHLRLALERAGIHFHSEQDDNKQLIEAKKEASELMGNSWVAVAKRLDLKKTDIDSIIHHHQHCLRSQIDEFFVLWQSRNKGEVPREMCRKLRQALREENLCGTGDGEAMEVVDNDYGARVETDCPMMNSGHSSTPAKGGGQGSKVGPLPGSNANPVGVQQYQSPLPQPPPRWSCSPPVTCCPSSEQTTAEMAFRDCSGDLQKGLTSPNSIATDLYSAYLLTYVQRDEVQNDALPADQRTERLLKHLGAQIRTDAAHFHTFVGILKNEPAYSSLVKKLETAYKNRSAK